MMRRGVAAFLIGVFGFAGVAVAAKADAAPEARLPKPRPMALSVRAPGTVASATLASTDAKAADTQASATEDLPAIRGPYLVADARAGA